MARHAPGYSKPDFALITRRIAERLVAVGMSARAASIAATGNPDTIRNIRTRNVMPSADRLSKLADVLKVGVGYLLGTDTDLESARGVCVDAPAYILTPADRAAPLRTLLNARIELRAKYLASDDDHSNEDHAKACAYDDEIAERPAASAEDVIAKLQYFALLHTEGFQPLNEHVTQAASESLRFLGQPSANEPTMISRLARMREEALERQNRLDSLADPCSDEATRWSRHWSAQYNALGTAIVAEPPATLEDVFTVLECVADLRDLVDTSEVLEHDRRICSELTTAAVVNCLPVLAAAARPDGLTRGQLHWARIATAKVAAREGR